MSEVNILVHWVSNALDRGETYRSALTPAAEQLGLSIAEADRLYRRDAQDPEFPPREVTMIQDYGMFTPEGNAVVHGIVLLSRVHEQSWLCTHQALVNLAKESGFEEAMDTAVRQAVKEATARQNSAI